MSTLPVNALKGAGYGLPVVVLGVLAATAFGAFTNQAVRHGRQAPITLAASPSRRTVAEGGTATYAVSMQHRSFVGRVGLTVQGLPAYTRSRLTYRGSTRTQAVLSVTTRLLLTPVGMHRFTLRAAGGGFSTRLPVVLTVQQPHLVSFGISGSVAGLQPGKPQPLNLSLRNPYSAAIVVTNLSVAAQGLNAPRTSNTFPCTLADFSIRQYAGGYPLIIPPSSTLTLSALGVDPSVRPEATLLDRPLNQDGCQGATLTLSYQGRAQIL
jgi:hypothetical protein